MGSKKKEVKEKLLDKMTAKELREVAKGISEITGAHGMNKEELVGSIKKARGIEDNTAGKSNASVRDIKKRIKALKADRGKAIEADDKKMADIYSKRIIRLKKKTRRAA